jgi:type IV pilus assembly protein PilC
VALFTYIATDKDGKPSKGTVTAENEAAALESLKKQGLHPLTVSKGKKGHDFKSLALGGKVKSKDLVVFTRQLATLINAGVPLVRSLSTLQSQTESATLKKQLAEVVKKVESGSALGDSLSEHPKTFSQIYVNMVRAGEEGGILDDVLKRLALQQEKDAALRGKIKSAMAYPTVISVITVVAFIFLMTSVVPKIGNIIKNIGGEGATLPIYTQILLKISDVMKTPMFLGGLFVVLPIATFLGRKYIKTPKGRYVWHSLLLKIPIVKVLIVKVAIARFARTFSALMGAGVPIIKAITTTAGAIGNAAIEKELLNSAKAIQAGGQLSTQLEHSKTFPPLVSQMLAIGEETGQTDQIVIKVAEFYEEEVDAFVDGLASVIEPVMIVVLGAVVGVIAASVFGPISQLSNQIGG